MIDLSQHGNLFITKPENDILRSLYSLIQDLKSGDLAKAPHQREFKWDKQKVKAWNQRIISSVTRTRASRPTGVIVTYQIPGDNTVYLNDGFQRLSASSLLLLDSTYYGVSSEQASTILRAYDMPVQHRIFDTHFDAMLDFQFINYGTPLTGYEFCKGFLLDIPGSNTNWQNLMNDLHSYMSEALNPFRGPQWSSGMTLDNKIQFGLRQNYGLFFRFLSQNKTLAGGYASITPKQPPQSEMESQRTVEQQLRISLDYHGATTAYDEFDLFKKVIKLEIGLITEIFNQTRPDLDTGLTKSFMRFLLSSAIWRRNNKVDEEAWKLFLVKLFYSLDAMNLIRISRDNESGRNLPISERSIAMLSRIGEIVGFDLTSAKKNPPDQGQFAMLKAG